MQEKKSNQKPRLKRRGKQNDMKLEIGTEITERNGGRIASIKKVTRVTAKRAFIKINENYEQQFKIEPYPNGGIELIGADRWTSISYWITTDQDKAELKHALAVQRLSKTEWGKLPEETVFKILELLKPTI